MKKIYYSYNKIHQDLDKLSNDVLNNFDARLMLTISGGGLIPSRIMRSYLNIPILCVSVQFYDDKTNEKHSESLEIQWFSTDQII